MLEFRFLFIGSRLLLIDFSGHRQEKPVPGGCGLAIHGQSTAFMSAVKGGTTRMAAKRPQQPHWIAAAVFPLTHNIHPPLSRGQKNDHT
ncbi:MAG: hypothetical protein MR913_02060 [Clostridiales bacterium]|nr:hypothetical protein [Clostridiales bacterium]